MSDREPDRGMAKEGRIHRRRRVRRRGAISTDWQWLDALTAADLDSELIEPVEERAEDLKRPRLEDLFA